MHAPESVEDGVLVGVVGGPGAKQLRHQHALAVHAATREDDRTALPAHHTRVNEDATRRELGHVELEVRLERVEERIELTLAPEPGRVGVERPESITARDDQ
jgi:hypothetical protein